MPAFFSPQNTWFNAGAASSYLNIEDNIHLSTSSTPTDTPSEACKNPPGCKVFSISRQDPSIATKIDLLDVEASESGGLRDQVLVFQYRGKFHAVDNKCPHASYPLSDATPFDIEDFGVILSAGITCPKHGWSFDLFTGRGDRGNYMLGVWEVELRPVKRDVQALQDGREEEGRNGLVTGDVAAGGDGVEGKDEEIEVWVRRKIRMG